MSLRFRRSIRLAPGLRINLGLRGPSLSVGPRGAGMTIGPSGLTSHVGIPGTGLSYRETHRLAVPRALPANRYDPEAPQPREGGVHLSLADDGRLCLATTDSQPLDPRIDRHLRESQHVQLAAWLGEQCKAINAEADEIIHLHRSTPSPRQSFYFSPIPFAEISPLEPPPLRLGLLDRVFGGRRRRRETEHAESVERYRTNLQRWEAARNAHQAEQEQLRHRWEDERLTSTDVMHELLEAALHAIHWPRETLVNFDLADGGKLLQLDIDLPEVEDMPTRSSEVAARGLKLNMHERSQTQVRQEYLTHIHGVLFRVIGETFSTLPTVQTIECSGFSQRIDPATGHERNDYLVSVRVLRDQWEQIDFANLSQVDPVASLERFDLRRDNTASGVLRPIAPFE